MVMMPDLKEHWEEEFDMALCVPYFLDGQGLRIDQAPKVFATKKERKVELDRRYQVEKLKRKRMEEQVNKALSQCLVIYGRYYNECNDIFRLFTILW